MHFSAAILCIAGAVGLEIATSRCEKASWVQAWLQLGLGWLWATMQPLAQHPFPGPLPPEMPTHPLVAAGRSVSTALHAGHGSEQCQPALQTARELFWPRLVMLVQQP